MKKQKISQSTDITPEQNADINPVYSTPVYEPPQKAFQYEIDYLIIRHGSEKDTTVIKVSADTEEEAFDTAAKLLDTMRTEDDPFTWHFLGNFKVTANER